MKRFTYLAVLVAVVLLGATLSANAGGKQRPKDWRTQDCRYQSLDGRGGYSTLEVKKTIICSAAKWPVPGGVATAECYAAHESGFYALAANPASSARGVFQVLDSTWRSWSGVEKAMRHREHVPARVLSGRANVMVSVLHAHAVGWGAWSGFAAYSC